MSDIALPFSLHRRIWFAVTALAALAGCGSSSGGPLPEVRRGSLPLPPAEPAYIAIPVTISLGSVRSRLEATFPPADSLDRARCTLLGGIVCHQYVYRREPLVVAMADDRFSVDARLNYRGRVALPGLGGVGSCGYAPQPMRRAALHFATSVYWRADWRLGARATDLRAELEDRCIVTVVGVDATPMMQRMADAQLLELRQEVDSLIPALVDLRPAADSLWRLFQQPLALDSTGNIWLTMAPDAIGLSSVAGSAGAIRTAVVFTARPRVVLGTVPPVALRPLPQLTVAPRAAGLRIPVDISLPFAELGRLATAALAGGTAGNGISIDRVTVRGAGDSAFVSVHVGGRVNGTLELTGTLGYDTAARVLRIEGLRYTLETEDFMSRVRATVGAPLIRRALDEATSHGRMEVGAQLDSLRRQLTVRLNGSLAPGIFIGGGVRDARVTAFHAAPDAFVVRMVLEGEAQLFVQQ